jgi:hypothetical protein
LMTFDTVAIETPASAATSPMVTCRWIIGGILNHLENGIDTG